MDLPNKTYPFRFSGVWKDLEPALATGEFIQTELEDMPYSLLIMHGIQQSFGDGIIKHYLSDLKYKEQEALEEALLEIGPSYPAPMEIKPLQSDRLKQIEATIEYFQKEIDTGIRLLPSTQIRALISDLNLKVASISAEGKNSLPPELKSLCLTCKVRTPHPNNKMNFSIKQ